MKDVFGREIKISPEIAGVNFKNPVLTASGTCGYGKELRQFFDISELGGCVHKGTTLFPKEGNDCPRIAEFNGGIINSIGLQNIGIKSFIEDILPDLSSKDMNNILNISGNTIEDYVKLCKILNNTSVSGIELNISCPNVKRGGLTFGTDENVVSELVSKCREATDKMLIVKLTPNVTDITKIALAAQRSGADAVTCINTFKGILYDVDKDEFKIKNIVGGVSGPAIKPMALHAVYECAKVLNIPIIGVGGIMDYKDALEFLKLGATLVQIGTATFKDPVIPVSIAHKLENILK